MRLPARVLAVALACCAASATAQTPQPDSSTTAEIFGRVTGADRGGLREATVILIGVAQSETDTSGAFRFAPIAPGTYFLRVIKLGVRPVLKNITVAAGERVRVDVALSRDAQELAAVVVRADSSITAISDVGGFRRRSRSGQGVYITGDEIERRHVSQTEHLFLGIPDVRVDTGGIVLIARGILSYKAFSASSVLRNHQEFLDCVGVQVFVDGGLMPQPFNVNTVPPRSIRGIELYRGPATTPSELRSPKTVCGTLAIWTR